MSPSIAHTLVIFDSGTDLPHYIQTLVTVMMLYLVGLGRELVCSCVLV